MFGSDQDDDLRERIVVFTTLGCLYSAQLKKLFKSKNIVFNEVQISNYPVGFMAVDKMLKGGSPTLSLPRVFSNGVYIGVCVSFTWSVPSHA
jgi:glutaredoxin